MFNSNRSNVIHHLTHKTKIHIKEHDKSLCHLPIDISLICITLTYYILHFVYSNLWMIFEMMKSLNQISQALFSLNEFGYPLAYYFTRCFQKKHSFYSKSFFVVSVLLDRIYTLHVFLFQFRGLLGVPFSYLRKFPFFFYLLH